MDTYSKYREHTRTDINNDFSENNTVKQRSGDMSNFHVKKGTEASRLEARKRSLAKNQTIKNLDDQ